MIPLLNAEEARFKLAISTSLGTIEKKVCIAERSKHSNAFVLLVRDLKKSVRNYKGEIETFLCLRFFGIEPVYYYSFGRLDQIRKLCSS